MAVVEGSSGQFYASSARRISGLMVFIPDQDTNNDIDAPALADQSEPRSSSLPIPNWNGWK